MRRKILLKIQVRLKAGIYKSSIVKQGSNINLNINNIADKDYAAIAFHTRCHSLKLAKRRSLGTAFQVGLLTDGIYWIS